MRIVTLASVRGAPGVTTTSLLLAAALDDAVVVEADLDGGVLAVRYGLGREPGLTTLAAAGAVESDTWRAHAQDAGGVPVLVGPDAPAPAASLWRSAGERITQRLSVAEGVAVVDAGRLRSPVLPVTASHLLLMLVRPVAEQLVALSHLLPAARRSIRGEIAVVLVGSGPYSAADVEEQLAVPVSGDLPDDPAANILRDGGSSSRLARSRLARSANALADRVTCQLQQPLEATTS